MNNKIIKNTTMLYLMNIAKMLFPLLTLPYLTRILTVECYGVVSYVKAVMQYMQLIVDFGFLLSGTKAIVLAKENKDKLDRETGDILAARLMLSFAAFLILLLVSSFIGILKKNILFTLLSFVPVFLTVFLFDYLFRGIEKMEVITMRFVVMRGFATFFTFVLVKRDADIIWIPILDIIGTLIAVILVIAEIKKYDFGIKVSTFKNVVGKIKESMVYFFSNMATTAFMALNTLLIGIFIEEAQVAYWSVCLQMVTAVQAMYTPLTDGIYPHMVKNRDFSVIKKALKLYMPLITAGCIFTLVFAPWALRIVGGAQYVEAAPVLRCMVPVLFFSFLSMIFGWPTLGAIGKQNETTLTTVITAFVQILGLVLFVLFGKFTLVNIALLRSGTEFLLFILRGGYCYKFRNEFAG